MLYGFRIAQLASRLSHNIEPNDSGRRLVNHFADKPMAFVFIDTTNYLWYIKILC